MHKIKRMARSQAWYEDEGETNFNPFAKARHPSTRRTTRSRDDLSRIQTEGDAHDAAAEQRRSQYGTSGANHFDTAPPQRSTGLSTLSAEDRVVNGEKAKEEEANIASPATSETAVGGPIDSPGPRKRKHRFATIFKKKKNERDLENGSDVDSEKQKKHKFSLWSQVRYSVFNSWVNVLLIFAPIGIALNFVPTVNPIVVFVINFIAIIPLAGTLSYATEEIALRVGETLGGLLNATFGNAVELIVSIIALFHDEITIVQTSLIGSMLSNLLLVMGMCFFLGGINRKRQHFNETVAQTAASLLALAIAGLVIPTAFARYADAPGDEDDADVARRDLAISRGTAVVLLLVYIAYLVFQLKTHEDVYSTSSKKVKKQNLFRTSKKKGDATKGLLQGANNIGGAGAKVHKDMQDDMTGQGERHAEEEDREEPTLAWATAIITLIWSTVLVAVCAEFLVDAIDKVIAETDVSRVFVGLILLPIVGNAAEHATALTVAIKDKMDLAIGVAVGSSMQIALLVLPLVVIVGWIAGKDSMTLNFDPFEIIILFVSVLLVNYLIADGESHWLEGLMLMILYIIIAVTGWFFPNNDKLPLGNATA